jgi:hypothetical protein
VVAKPGRFLVRYRDPRQVKGLAAALVLKASAET